MQDIEECGKLARVKLTVIPCYGANKQNCLYSNCTPFGAE